MGFGELLTSVFGGGLTGLLGVIVQKVADYKAKKLELEIQRDKQHHEIELRKVDAAIMQQEWAARTKVAEVEAAGAEAVADSKAFAISLASEPKRYSEGIPATPRQAWMMFTLDLLRGIVRPGLTIYLCAITTIIYVQANKLIQGGIEPTDAVEIVKVIINTILYLTTTCILFWFGTRNKQAGPKL